MRESNERVSVIIPTFNYARFLPDAIDSVLAQTYPHFECIVVDDGSTDQTSEVLQRYEGRVRVIRQQNQGLSAARNTGITHATGTLLAFLDADDWWAPEKLQVQVAYLGEHGDVDVVGCGEYAAAHDRSVMRGGRVMRYGEPGPSPVENLQRVALGRLWMGGSGSGLLARASVFSRVGLFDVELRAAEDWDMWLRLAASCRFVNLPEGLVYRRWHSTGVFRNVERMEQAQWRVYHSAVSRWPRMLNVTTRMRMRARIVADAGGEHAGNGALSKALFRYVQAFAYWPCNPRVLMKVLTLALRMLLPRQRRSCQSNGKS